MKQDASGYYSFNTSNTLFNNIRKFNSILLIDDDVINNYITAGLLRKLNLSSKISAFKNGKEALDFIKSTETGLELYPDLIFLDIHMPIMDGYDFAIALEGLVNKKEMKIVMLSTSIREEDKERLKLLDIRFFITKPLTEDKLRELLKTMNDQDQ